jgi:hypothetical protein
MEKIIIIQTRQQRLTKLPEDRQRQIIRKKMKRKYWKKESEIISSQGP